MIQHYIFLVSFEMSWCNWYKDLIPKEVNQKVIKLLTEEGGHPAIKRCKLCLQIPIVSSCFHVKEVSASV